MPILDLLSPQHVLANVAAADKAQLLEQLAAMLAGSSAEQRLIGEALNSRERLGSTGIGRGVAIPHGRVPGLDRARAVLLRLSSPLVF
ncbi:MAG: PTS sugar transporter subunit IIA, partial [Dokdonella sp.]